MGMPVTWFEVNGPKPEQTAKFFSDLFGWHTETVEGGYILIDTHAGRGINGGFGKPAEGQEAHSVFYAQTPDIQALLDKASALGCETVVPVTEIPEMVTYATFIDPFGNLVGIIRATRPNPPTSQREITRRWIGSSSPAPNPRKPGTSIAICSAGPSSDRKAMDPFTEGWSLAPAPPKAASAARAAAARRWSCTRSLMTSPNIWSGPRGLAARR